jgi:hydrogenase expression/formation protein HypC
MCLAIPGRIVAFADEPLFARVEVSGVRRTVNVGLLTSDPPVVGDWVLIHVGFALSKIGEREAEEQLQLLRILGEEMAALEEVGGYAFAEAET